MLGLLQNSAIPMVMENVIFDFSPLFLPDFISYVLLLFVEFNFWRSKIILSKCIGALCCVTTSRKAEVTGSRNKHSCFQVGSPHLSLGIS